MNRDQARETLEKICRAGIAAVEPGRAIGNFLQRDGDTLLAGAGTDIRAYSLGAIHRILVVGCGKAGAPMAMAVESCAGEKVAAGAVTVKYGHAVDIASGMTTTIYEAGHPTPDKAGEYGARKAAELLKSAGPNDLVFAVISGGGSALWPSPVEGISLEDKRNTTEILLCSGADINELNCIRKHLSAIKGGLAARQSSCAKGVEVMVISDVVGDPLDVIASGPFYPDSTCFDDVMHIIDKYKLRSKLPKFIINHMLKGVSHQIPDTPKADDNCFLHVNHTICAGNGIALRAAAAMAEKVGFRPIIVTSQLTGNVTDAANKMCGWIREQAGSREKPVCILSGGETTVVLGESHGKGGRNQEFALNCAISLAGSDRNAMISCGTDGTDGPTDAAGAFCDGETVAKGLALEMNAEKYLEKHDSYNFFNRIGDLVKTGPTMTNVMDIQAAIIW